MKPLVKNKVFRFILLASLIVFSIQSLSYAQQEDTATQGFIPISERTPQVRDAIVAAIGVDVDKINETHLTSVTSLNLRNKSITSLKSGDFSGLTALTNLNLHRNQLNSLPDGIFSGLTSLKTLRLAGNAIEPIPIEISLQQVAEGQFKAVTPTGSPFDIVLPLVVKNGNIADGATQVTILQGNIESQVLTVSRPIDMITAVTVDISTLPECPAGYYGCTLSKSGDFPLEIRPVGNIQTANIAPVFREGPNTTRIVGETAISGTHIGSALAATDADNDELTFSLGGPDAAAFHIDSTTGQLTTYAPLNYEIKPIYTVTATVSDGSLTDTLTVTIDVNAAPKFPEGKITTRVVMEDTLSGTTLGKPILATDLNGDPLTYTLGGIDVEAFELNYDNYLKTRVPLNYDDRRVYCVTITASDGSLTDTITVVTSVVGANDALMSGKFVPVHERTPQVRDAIVDALPDVEEPEYVTLAHLTTITHLNLRNSGISKLKSGDFSGLTALTDLNLHNNHLSFLPKGIFKDLTMLKTLRLGSNAVKKASVILYLKQVSEDEFKVMVPSGAPFDMILPVTVINGVITHGETPLVIPQGKTESATFGVACPLGRPITPTVVLNTLPNLPPGHYGYRIAQSTVHLRTPQVAEAITAAVPGITDPHYVTDIHLAAITTLRLDNKKITSLKVGDFAGMLSLRTIFLQNNELKSVPYNIFSGLRALTYLDLSSNVFTSVPISFDGLLSLRYLDLSGNRFTSLSESSFVGIPDLEQLHLGGNLVDPLRLRVKLEKVGDDQFKAVVPAGAPFTMYLPITVQNGRMANGATPIIISTGEVESQSHTVIRSDNTVDAVTASIGTFPDIPEFHTGYFLGRSDGTALDPIPLAVIDSINVPPVFTEGDNAVRTVPENTPAGTYIGAPIAATDANKENTIVYTLGGTDAANFDIDEQTGQLKTKTALDYETKSTYTITITVSDGIITDTITVTISISDIEETPENSAPVFAEGSSSTRAIAENTDSGVNIGTPITATDADEDTLTYSLGGTDKDAFSLNSTTGQLITKTALDYETKPSYSLTITADDGNDGSVSITVTINITDIAIERQQTAENNPPVFTEGDSTTRSIAENTDSEVNIGTPITATDADGDTLTYSLGGTDKDAFSLNSTTGQLITKTALDYETKTNYSITITADDGNDSRASINVTINVADIDEQPVNEEPENEEPINEQPENNVPVFTEGSSTTRSIAENTDISTYFGTPIAAIDPDGDTLTYSLNGTDAEAFTVDSTTGQLQTSATLDYETKSSYSVTITASDGKGGITSIDVTINVTDIDETPVNTPINEQPENSAPAFTEGSSTTRSIPENTDSGVNIGTPVTATGANGNTFIYSLAGDDADAFSINSRTGQIMTKAALDYETKSTYKVIVNVSGGISSASIASSDGVSGASGTSDASDASVRLASTVSGNGVAITVTINIADIDETPVNAPINEQPQNSAPVFTESSSTTRSIAENTNAGTSIGNAVSATDADGDTLTYSLGGTDATSFSINSATGQLQTSAALDYETKSNYTVTITATDGNGGSASINVTINITDIRETAPRTEIPNRAPVFTEGSSTTRSVAENTSADTNIGSPIAATDPDNNTLTYSLDGTDAASFSLNTTTGQLQTSAALDYEAKSSYTVKITATDGKGGTASITVTINITNVNEAPVFADGSSTTRSIAENTSADTNIGSPIAATDPDNNTLTYSLGGTDAASFSLNTTTGQLQTSAALDYEAKSSYTVKITASDGKGGSASITVTISINDITENRPPVFADGSTTTRSIAENTASDVNIGSAVSATDPDNNTLTYSLGGTDAASFSLNSGTGQLQTSAALDYEAKSSYTVKITATDGTYTRTITVTINVTDVNEIIFSEGSSTTRSIAENKNPGTDIGDPVSATDPKGETITYSLSGTDADTFGIVGTTGQLWPFQSFDHETKSSYTVTVTATNESGATASITVTIDITDVNESPRFSEGSTTTRSIAENTASNTNIGTAVKAKDPEDDPMTYSLGGTDKDAFSLNSKTGQLQTSTALDYETKASYTVTITAADNNDNDKSITVTINVINVNDNTPVFTDGSSTTRSIAENTGSGNNIGTAVAATDADGDTLIYSLNGTDEDSFSINSGTGQLQTSAALDSETKSSYTVTISASDGKNSTSITVTVNVTNVNERPVWNDNYSTTFSVSIDASTGTKIGDPFTATDPDGDEITYYTVGAGTHNKIVFDRKTGQLSVGSNFAKGITVNVGDTISFRIFANANLQSTSKLSITINIVEASAAPAVQQSPAKTNLFPNYPNPFNPETWIPYHLSKSANVTLTIYNMNGEMVRQLALGHKTAGVYLSRSRAIHWDGKNQAGEKVATGVYFYRFTAGDFSATRKMLIIK